MITDYPISATLSAEHNPFGSRAVLMAIVFASFSLGTMAAAMVFLILVSAFHRSIDRDPSTIQYVWRLLLLVGIIPALCTVLARFRMRETEACAYPYLTAPVSYLVANTGKLSCTSRLGRAKESLASNSRVRTFVIISLHGHVPKC
jgi:MFS family permease